jgi:protein-tyrosine phosphatase
MAEALLRKRLDSAGVEARVHSAGLLGDDRAASADGIAVMADRGIDTSVHRSRRMTAEMIEGADLVVGMAREHVREAVLLVPDAWTKTFTLKELVRRGTDVGPRTPDQPVDEWLAKVNAGRTRSDMLGSSSADDVADPIGQSRAMYERTAAELEQLVERMVALVWGATS